MNEDLEKIIIEALDESPKFKIDPNKKFEDFDNWDSLSAMLVIDSVFENYNVQLDPENVGNFTLKKLSDECSK